MTLGISGTGPYGELRRRREENQMYRYELELIEQGMRHVPGKKRLLELIAANKKRIKEINLSIKKGK